MNEQKKISKELSLVEHGTEMIFDIFIGAMSGIVIEYIADVLRRKLGYSRYISMFIQILLMVFVLHEYKSLKIWQLRSWEGQYDYGILFTSMLLASQRNLSNTISDIHGKFYKK